MTTSRPMRAPPARGRPREPERQHESKEDGEHHGGDVIHPGHDTVADRGEQARERRIDHVLRGGEQRLDIHHIVQVLDDGEFVLHAHGPGTQGGELGGGVAQKVDQLTGDHRDHQGKEQDKAHNDDEQADEGATGARQTAPLEEVHDRGGHESRDRTNRKENQDVGQGPDELKHHRADDDHSDDDPNVQKRRAHEALGAGGVVLHDSPADDDHSDDDPNVQKRRAHEALGAGGVVLHDSPYASGASPEMARRPGLTGHDPFGVDLILDLLERPAQQAADLDLGDAELLGDLDLRHALEEAHLDDVTLPRGEARKRLLDDDTVVRKREIGILGRIAIDDRRAQAPPR